MSLSAWGKLILSFWCLVLGLHMGFWFLALRFQSFLVARSPGSQFACSKTPYLHVSRFPGSRLPNCPVEGFQACSFPGSQVSRFQAKGFRPKARPIARPGRKPRPPRAAPPGKLAMCPSSISFVKAQNEPVSGGTGSF